MELNYILVYTGIRILILKHIVHVVFVPKQTSEKILSISIMK